MGEKTTYIVSFQRDTDAPWCTNVVLAECESDIQGKYGGCVGLHFHKDAYGEAERLRVRGCPVIVCSHKA